MPRRLIPTTPFANKNVRDAKIQEHYPQRCASKLPRRPFINPTVLRSQRAADPTISTSDGQMLARRGVGVPYKRVIRNDDYRFSVTFPEGLVGWGGVAPCAISWFCDLHPRCCIGERKLYR